MTSGFASSQIAEFIKFSFLSHPNGRLPAPFNQMGAWQSSEIKAPGSEKKTQLAGSFIAVCGILNSELKGLSDSDYGDLE